MYGSNINQYGEFGMRQAAAGAFLGASIADMQTKESAVRKSEVQDELDRLSRTVDQLGATTDMLRKRLEPVRRQTGGVGANSQASTPEPVLCDLASTIRSRRQLLEQIQILLDQAENELEI